MPRHRPWADALDALGDAVAAATHGERTLSRVVAQRLPGAPLRLSSTSGRVHIRRPRLSLELVAIATSSA